MALIMVVPAVVMKKVAVDGGDHIMVRNILISVNFTRAAVMPGWESQIHMIKNRLLLPLPVTQASNVLI